MKEELRLLVAYWWEKMYPLRRKFVKETLLNGLEEEDLEQECFLQLCKALEQYDSERGVPFESYYKVVLHGWRSNQNQVKARKELAFGEDEMFFLTDERVNVEHDVETKILIEEVLESLSRFDEKERRIIEAFYFEHKKLIDIADELAISIKTAERKKRQTLSKLRAILGEYAE